MFVYMQSVESKLRVLMRTELDGDERLVFERLKPFGDFWQRVEIVIKGSDVATISGDTKLFEVIIEGTNEQSGGTIAIDDTSFTAKCVRAGDDDQLPEVTTRAPPSAHVSTTTASDVCKGQFRCKTQRWNQETTKMEAQCVPQTAVCNFHDDCHDRSDETECGSCNFEQSSCGFVDESSGGIAWSRELANSNNHLGPV